MGRGLKLNSELARAVIEQKKITCRRHTSDTLGDVVS